MVIVLLGNVGLLLLNNEFSIMNFTKKLLIWILILRERERERVKLVKRINKMLNIQKEYNIFFLNYIY